MSDDDKKVTKLPVRKKPAGKCALKTVHSYGGCRHARFEVDEKLALVKCADCSEMLNPIWVLMELATEERILTDRWASMRAEVQLMGERTRVKCLHCNKFTPVRSNVNVTDIANLAARIKRECVP